MQDRRPNRHKASSYHLPNHSPTTLPKQQTAGLNAPRNTKSRSFKTHAPDSNGAYILIAFCLPEAPGLIGQANVDDELQMSEKAVM